MLGTLEDMASDHETHTLVQVVIPREEFLHPHSEPDPRPVSTLQNVLDSAGSFRTGFTTVVGDRKISIFLTAAGLLVGSLLTHLLESLGVPTTVPSCGICGNCTEVPLLSYLPL